MNKSVSKDEAAKGGRNSGRPRPKALNESGSEGDVECSESSDDLQVKTKKQRVQALREEKEAKLRLLRAKHQQMPSFDETSEEEDFDTDYIDSEEEELLKHTKLVNYKQTCSPHARQPIEDAEEEMIQSELMNIGHVCMMHVDEESEESGLEENAEGSSSQAEQSVGEGSDGLEHGKLHHARRLQHEHGDGETSHAAPKQGKIRVMCPLHHEHGEEEHLMKQLCHTDDSGGDSSEIEKLKLVCHHSNSEESSEGYDHEEARLMSVKARQVLQTMRRQKQSHRKQKGRHKRPQYSKQVLVIKGKAQEKSNIEAGDIHEDNEEIDPILVSDLWNRKKIVFCIEFIYCRLHVHLSS